MTPLPLRSACLVVVLIGVGLGADNKTIEQIPPGDAPPTALPAAAPPAEPPDVDALLIALEPLLNQIQQAIEHGDPQGAARLQRQLVDALARALGADHNFVEQAREELEIHVGDALTACVAEHAWDAAVQNIVLLDHLHPQWQSGTPGEQRWAELFLLRWCLNQDYLDAATELIRLRRAAFAILPLDDAQALERLILEAQFAERRTNYSHAAELYALVHEQSLVRPASADDLNAASEALQRESIAGITQVATMLGQWDTALDSCRRWRRIALQQGPGGAESVAESWLAEGVVLRYSGRLADAEIACRRALIEYQLATPANAPPSLGTATVLNELAILQFALGEPTAAHRSGLDAWRIYASWLGMDAPVVARLEGNLAEIARRLPLEERQQLEGFLDLALERATSAQSVPPRVLATLRQTAGLYAELDLNWTAARENFSAALQIRRAAMGEQHHATARALHHLAQCELALGEFAAAGQHLESAAATLSQRFGETHVESAMAVADLGLAMEIQGQSETAIGHYRTALERLAAGRTRVGVRGLESLGLSEANHVAVRLATLLAHVGRFEEATAVWQESLGSSLREELAIRQLRSLAPQEFLELRDLEDDYARLTAQVERLSNDDQASNELSNSLRGQRDVVQAHLVQKKRELLVRQPLVGGESFDLSDLQAQLPPDFAFVGWVSRDELLPSEVPSHWGVAIRRTGRPLWIRLPDNYSSAAATGLREAIARQDFAPLPELTVQVRELARLVWTPLVSILGANDGLPAAGHVVVMPSPGLQGIPIDVLAADTVNITYAPSGLLWAWLRQRTTSANGTRGTRLLALGDPNFIDPHMSGAQRRWSPLPGTRQEVAAIADVCRRRQLAADIQFGSAASQQVLQQLSERDQLRSYRFLHFATHGEANPHVPLRSRLILAQDQLPELVPSDESAQGPVVTGELTAEEILRTWTLKADLVTLSACESALGRFTASEGYVGLSQALLLAGCQSVVSSLWKVDDLATAFLMVRFYENLLGVREDLDRPLARAAALQEAKHWLRRLTFAQQQDLLDQIQSGRPLLTPKTLADSKADPADCVYAHPHYWAAFVLIGDGD